MTLPTFLIAGAQKCGTTSLAGALREHPEIFMTKRKELHFFDRHYDRGLEWYERHFTPEPQHRQFGEATPAYMFDKDARSRLAQTLPEAKIVIILRDPVSRAYSHYWHKRRLGDEPLTSFEDAVAAEPERMASNRVRVRNGYSYITRGYYMDQIEPMVEAHGRDRVHVLLLDDLTADRVGTLRTLLEFLEVDPGPAQELNVGQRNKYRVTTESGDVQPVQYEPMAEATRLRLQELYAESNARLAEFLGRDLSHWQRG